MHRLADNEDYAPFQIDWVGVQAKQLQCEGSLCGCLPEPLVIGDTLSPLGYKFRGSPEPLQDLLRA